MFCYPQSRGLAIVARLRSRLREIWTARVFKFLISFTAMCIENSYILLASPSPSSVMDAFCILKQSTRHSSATIAINARNLDLSFIPSERIPIVILGLAPFCIAIYLPLYQWNVVKRSGSPSSRMAASACYIHSSRPCCRYQLYFLARLVIWLIWRQE